jgi:hypothetical protein
VRQRVDEADDPNFLEGAALDVLSGRNGSHLSSHISPGGQPALIQP